MFFVNKLLIESNQLSKSSHNTQHFEDPAVKLSLSSTNYLSSKSLVSKANALVHKMNLKLQLLAVLHQLLIMSPKVSVIMGEC